MAHFDRRLAAYQRLALFVDVYRPDLVLVLEAAAMRCGVGRRAGWRKREEGEQPQKARPENPAFEVSFGRRK